MTEKKCSKCGEIKPLDEYGVHTRSPDGLRSYCKPCQKKYRRQLRERNPHVRPAISNRRRARAMNASGNFSASDWNARLDYHGGQCVYCGASGKMEIEHRIPLSRGGTNWPANLVPACKSCNCKKGTKTETEYKQLLASKEQN